MNIHLHAAARSRGPRWLVLVAAFVTLAFAANVSAQAPAASGGAATARSAEELDVLVGRIALYPDDLVALILPAATNPLQIVQADRFLEKRKSDPNLQLDERWDDAVKSLLNYPEVVKTMSGDLDWTAELGEAVVEDQGAVLEAIQVFRRRTQAVGNLKTDDKQAVVIEKEVIKIVPADPQVIYVPQYNPSTVVVYGGYSSWGYYPSPYPVYYYPYPPGVAIATGIIWGAALGAIWHGGHYHTHYGGRGNNNININKNININSGNINRGGVNRPGISGPDGSNQWKPNKQPGQVSGTVGRPQQTRVGDARAGGAARPTSQTWGGGSQPSAQPAGGGAFGGASSSGRQAQMNSSRGASSRNSMSSGARPAPSANQRPAAGSGARAGAGGGSRGGGGRGAGGRR